MTNMQIDGEQEMKQLGQRLASLLKGGEVLELVGDVGAGKTTLTKGLALGLGISDPVQSPTFTISRIYQANNGLELAHYDFYRLGEAGIMGNEINETASDPKTITVVEWAGAVKNNLPNDRLEVNIKVIDENKRLVEFIAHGDRASQLKEQLA